MNTIARIRQGKKHFEIIVDLDKALDFKKGISSSQDFLEIEKVFTDSKKGQVASGSDLKEAFRTEEINEIAKKIVKNGEVVLHQEHRDEEKDKKFKQIVDFLVTNSINPQTGNPYTAETIKNALEQAHVNVKNTPVENQVNEIIAEISKIIPIKIEMKKIKLTIPAMYTGTTYGLINQYKEEETWLPNGDLNMIINIPAGSVFNVFDKLNSATKGSVLTEEIKKEND
ncbi:MAG: ribosome assembly factor SBDS [Nanoarchaeota archaeon]|nr:ribosome assembly factor SBDS [Nanoarchaeota archaeon]